MTEREVVYNKYQGHCAYCGKEIKFKDMQVDHFHPKHLTGWIRSPRMVELYKLPAEINDISNKMPSCRRCNHYKRGHTIKGFRILMADIHKRIEKIYINKVALDFGIMRLTPFNGELYYEYYERMEFEMLKHKE
jgi:5-methylcytosine-specific restriction endonuclease McrA